MTIVVAFNHSQIEWTIFPLHSSYNFCWPGYTLLRFLLLLIPFALHAIALPYMLIAFPKYMAKPLGIKCKSREKCYTVAYIVWSGKIGWYRSMCPKKCVILLEYLLKVDVVVVLFLPQLLFACLSHHISIISLSFTPYFHFIFLGFAIIKWIP